jgi:hypothetical protein
MRTPWGEKGIRDRDLEHTLFVELLQHDLDVCYPIKRDMKPKEMIIQDCKRDWLAV